MPASLPPLTALRAFEATARHLSMKKAANELNVTAAAISHQIQFLEEQLGVRLFHRRNRRIELTELAQSCLPMLRDGFEQLRQAVDHIRNQRAADVLTVGASPSLASRWLMPRLHRFVLLHPEIDVRVSTQMRQFTRLPSGSRGDFESVIQWADEVDLLAVFGNGHYPGMQIDQLLPLEITPLCSPALLAAGPRLKKPTDLTAHTLLHDDRGMLYEGRSFWERWLDAAGIRHPAVASGPHFTHSVLAIEAALAGLGIVATTPALVSGELARGTLVAPFALRVALPSGYFLVSNPLAARRSVVGVFRAWLLDEARQEHAAPGSIA